MNSLDTNLLLYALDETAPGHDSASTLYLRLFSEPESWIIADQTLFELYRALRNPRVLERPLSTREAIAQIEEIRAESRALHVAYEATNWTRVLDLLVKTGRRKGLLVFDAVLAVTLHAQGVKRFYTRNVKDFEAFELFEVVDPLR